MNNEHQLNKKCDQPGTACCQEVAWESLGDEATPTEQVKSEQSEEQVAVGCCGGGCACASV